jgi:tetratricopeptide (TPR) repeat protein
MITGSLPFQGNSLTAKLTSILTQPVPDLAQLAPDIPEALADLVFRMLEKDPMQRIPSVRQVGLELEAIQKRRDVPVRVPPKPSPSSGLPAFMEQGAEIEPPVFVTRESELALLDRFLSHALEGHGQVAFITGDPGQGKTALAREFALRAQKSQPDLLVAGGNCNAYTGIGDPYLPFREIISLLTRDVESRWEAWAIGREQARRLWLASPLTVQALVDTGRDLVEIFISGDALLKRAAAFSPWPERGEWLPKLEQLVERKASLPSDPSFQQAALFEQYTRVLRALARDKPLLLILDDLQWADSGSINLLFHLGKRLEGGRIMILGAYRPTEVALGRSGERHPLEPIVNELKRQFGDIQIDIGKSDGRGFVDAYIDSEPNRLGEAFRATLAGLTGGHALGTVELLRDMQERGGLERDREGRWIEGKALDWETLPARVEAMIAERIERLDLTERQVLKVASVEGETFTAEVVAKVLDEESQSILSLLSNELDKRHRLVSAQNIRHVDGRRLSIFRFQHILFQRYIHGSLDPVERSNLHQAVGAALNSFYAEGRGEISGQLARHFQEAGTDAQAANFLVQAGDRASHLVAYQEAIDHYEQARSAYERALGSQWDPLQRAVLERKIGESYYYYGDHARALDHFNLALSYLGHPMPVSRWGLRLGILREVFIQTAHRLFSRWLVKPIGGPADLATVEEHACLEPMGWIEATTNAEHYLYVALHSINFFEQRGYAHGISTACAGFGVVLQYLGLFRLADGYHRRSVELAERTQDKKGLGHAYSLLALYYLATGNLSAGKMAAFKSAEVCKEADNLRNWGFAMNLAVFFLMLQGRFAESASGLQEMLQAGRDGVDRTVECWALSKKGVLLWMSGQLQEAVSNLQACIEIADSIPDLAFRIGAETDLGRSYYRLGKLDQALSTLEEASELNLKNPQGYGFREGLTTALAESYVAVAERSDVADRKPWLRKANRACQEAIKASRTGYTNEPLALLLRGRLAWINNRSSAALKDWQRSLKLAEKMGLRYDEGIIHLEMGKRLGDREHLEQAMSILSEIGAEWDLKQAQQALEKL